MRLRGCEADFLLKEQLKNTCFHKDIEGPSYLNRTIDHAISHRITQGQYSGSAAMAMNGSPKPTISSDIPLPSIPGLSPHPSSSSDSFDSSRPNSQGSSATSRSVSPSPIPKSVLSIDSHKSIELSALHSSSTPPENTPADQTRRQEDPQRSVQPAPAVRPDTNNGILWLHRLRSLIPRRNWFANAVGVVSLGLTLIGMIIFENRTYKVTVVSALNEALGTCGQLNSVSSSILKITLFIRPFLMSL